jgi:predicted nucleotidyltransferase
MIALIEDHLEEIVALCREFGVARLDLFGSAAADTFGDESDLDFVAIFSDTSPGSYADRYLDLAESLERLFGRKVDLLTERAIRNPYFRREVDATRRVVYDERRQEAAA